MIHFSLWVSNFRHVGPLEQYSRVFGNKKNDILHNANVIIISRKRTECCGKKKTIISNFKVDP
jgi:hypothetical protein